MQVVLTEEEYNALKEGGVNKTKVRNAQLAFIRYIMDTQSQENKDKGVIEITQEVLKMASEKFDEVLDKF